SCWNGVEESAETAGEGTFPAPLGMLTQDRNKRGVMSSFRYMLMAAFALGLTAQTLPAQFTTVVVPPPKEQRPSVPRYVFRDSTRDTSTARRLAEMSAWVDSAAVAMGIEPIEAESLAATVPADTTSPERVAEVPADTSGAPPTDSL